jgi:hypothetical protein
MVAHGSYEPGVAGSSPAECIVWMSELVKERVLRTLGEIRVGSSPTPHNVLGRSSQAAHTLRIGRTRRLVRLKDRHRMSLGLEEHPLERPGHLQTTFCRRNLGLLLKPFASILFGLNDDGLHLKM